MYRWELLNLLAFKYRYNDYLEIGCQNVNVNFNKIIAFNKISVDPEPVFEVHHKCTSDEFFSRNLRFFDLIFIDGLHHYEQVLKDVNNALNCLLPNGTIVVHDCLPTTEVMQQREDNGGEWTGDVWKAIAILRVTRPDLTISVVDTDYGCGLIKKGFSKTYIPLYQNYLNWEYYFRHKTEMLNVIPKPDLNLINI